MRFELGKWNQMPGLLTEGYKKINEILVSCQGDGKAL